MLSSESRKGLLRADCWDVRVWAEHKGCTQPLQQSGVDVEGRKKEKKKGFDFQKSKFRQVTQR